MGEKKDHEKKKNLVSMMSDLQSFLKWLMELCMSSSKHCYTVQKANAV